MAVFAPHSTVQSPALREAFGRACPIRPHAIEQSTGRPVGRRRIEKVFADPLRARRKGLAMNLPIALRDLFLVLSVQVRRV